MDDAARHALAELMRAEARAAHPAERRIELADLELRQRLDGGEIADVEGQEAGMGAPASRLLLPCAYRLILLVDPNRDASAARAGRQRPDRVRGLWKDWMIIVAAGAFRPRQVGDVHNPEARVPAARPHLVAKAQRMMQPLPPSRPGGCLAARDVLPRHPPPR